MQIQTFLFRQRRHHCLFVLQLNNVQAFVNVLESSAVAIVYTSVLESQVSYSCHQDCAHHSLSSEVTRFPKDTMVTLMSFLSTCNFCVMMIAALE